MIRLLAMDLDETLLSRDKHVSLKNVQALKKAREKGIHTVIATGRPWFSFAHTLDELETRNLENEYSISMNGGMIVENRTGKPVFMKKMPFEQIEGLFNLALENDVFVHIYTDDQVYAWNLNEDERSFLKNRLEVTELEKPDLTFLKDRNFLKILFGNTDISVLQKIEKEHQNEFDGLSVSYSSGRYLEFNPENTDKGTGLKRLASLMGLELSSTAALGDHVNDISMIETAGLGISVANGVKALKEKADLVTASDHDHNAAAEAVEIILKINEMMSSH